MNISFLKVMVGLAMTLTSYAAMADFVVVVNLKNPAALITKEQISQCFLGATNNWTPVDLPESSPIRTDFYKVVTDTEPSQVRSIWSKLVFTGKARPAKQLLNSDDVKKQVASDVNAIGYIDKSAADGTVRVVYPPN